MGRGRRKQGRRVDGILLLDKALGLSSNAALQEVKRLYRARKAGHTGSLDPQASGMLPICFGEATKLSGFLLDADKSYRVRGKLGEKTSTGDSEGEVVERKAHDHITTALLQSTLKSFLGTQSQIPPMHSAVKHEGKRLYELAREGQVVERKPRTIQLYELRLLNFESDSFELDIRCSKGTYIRTLVEDLAQAMDSVAHVTVLRRTRVGPFEEESMHGFSGLRALFDEGDDVGIQERQDRLDELLLPLDSALGHWPDVRLDKDSAYYLQKGQPVQVPRAPTEGLVRVYGPDDEFIGVGEITEDGRVGPRRMMKQASNT